jgi:glycosyl transferase family 25
MAFYINLDRRVDRRTDFESECQKMNICVERFPAITHSVSPIGTTRSHLEVLKLAKQRKYESVLIFEDDFSFSMSPIEFDTLRFSVPKDYDVVMFDYSNMTSHPYNDEFVRVLEAQVASCYLVHSRMYDRLISNLEEAVCLYEANPDYHWLYINDQYWKHLQPVSNWYASRVRVGRQRPGFSDLQGRYTENDY